MGQAVQQLVVGGTPQAGAIAHLQVASCKIQIGTLLLTDGVSMDDVLSFWTEQRNGTEEKYDVWVLLPFGIKGQCKAFVFLVEISSSSFKYFQFDVFSLGMILLYLPRILIWIVCRDRM